MARARSIKPGFYESEQVGTASMGARLLFIALWQMADRDGILEDRPMQIKAYAFRYDAMGVDVVDGWLNELNTLGLIVRYQIESQKLIEIPNFSKHQNPHPNEKKSGLPRNYTSEGGMQGGGLVKLHERSRNVTSGGGLVPEKSRNYTSEGGMQGGGLGPLNVSCFMFNGVGLPDSRPEAPPQQPDPQQLVSEAVEEVAKHWPVCGNVPNAKRAWEREAAVAVEGVAAWCEKIQRTALAHSVAHEQCKRADKRHFIPTLEKWVYDGDYARPAPKVIESTGRQATRFALPDREAV